MPKLREPLVLFVVLGVLLYAGWQWLAPEPSETIVIDAASLRALEANEEELRGRPLTDEEREAIREGFVDDEILIREAVRRGLHWADGRVRQRLSRIMRGALTDTVPEPSRAQLEAYFRDNIDRFSRDPSTTLHQVMFPWGDETADEEIQTALARLRAGGSPDEFGSSLAGTSTRVGAADRRRLVQEFGGGFADLVDQASLGEWMGPVDSPRGRHLIVVIERHPAEVAEYDAVERYLRDDWMLEQGRQRQQARIDELRARYRVEFGQ